MRKIVFVAQLVFMVCPALGLCQGLKRNDLNSLGFSKTQDNLVLQQSIGQPSGYTTFYQSGLVLRQGFIQPSTGVKSRSDNPSMVSVWPNPAKDLVNVKLLTSDFGQAPYSLYNSSGSIVLKGSFTNGITNTLQLQGFSPGVYTLLVYLSETSAIKIIKTP